MKEIVDKTFKKYTSLENDTIFNVVSENIRTLKFSHKFIAFKKHRNAFFKWTTIVWIVLFFLFAIPIWTFFIPLFMYLFNSLVHFIDISMITRSMGNIQRILSEEHSLDVPLDDLFVYSFIVMENWDFFTESDNENDYE